LAYCRSRPNTSHAATTTACATAGSGYATTWLVAGSTTAYAGTLTTTDGYNVKASMTFTNATTSLSGETMGTSAVGAGTCVATLTTAGAVPTATDATVGNFAICHFIFFTATASATASPTVTAAYTASTHWGVTKYLTATQWGSTTAATGIIGSTMNSSSSGTAVTTATWGMVYDPTTKPTGFVINTVYSMTWFQPKEKSAYTASELRRYSGGNHIKDQVKAYCISPRLTATTTHVSTGITAGTATTLAGASALAAGAIALGVAALAI